MDEKEIAALSYLRANLYLSIVTPNVLRKNTEKQILSWAKTKVVK